MKKLYVGARLRRLREQRKLNQAALAARLGLSLSYVSQLESNQRPVTATVLLKLTEVFECDIGEFSEDRDRRLVSELQEVFRDRSLSAEPVTPAQIARMVEQVPELATALVSLQQRQLRLQEEYEQLVGRFYGSEPRAPLAPLPHEEVRDFFNRRNNHIDAIDLAAEQQAQQWRLQPGERAPALRLILRETLGIELMNAAEQGAELRRYDPQTRQLRLAASLSDAQQAFQMATQLALLQHRELIETELEAARFASEQATALARQDLAHYFAAALLLPYEAFLATARETRYDLEALQQRYDVSFESVCHRLSTLQRSGARGVPFYLVRVDQAGNISKRLSAASFHFARLGGACPLWHVHDAFSQPGRIRLQIAETPDGTRFFGLARTIERGGGSYYAPRKLFAIGIGCEIRHAAELVYADGIDLDAPQRVVPIGPGCRVCPRPDCTQRAFPPGGRTLVTDANRETLISYRFAEGAGG